MLAHLPTADHVDQVSVTWSSAGPVSPVARTVPASPRRMKTSSRRRSSTDLSGTHASYPLTVMDACIDGWIVQK